LIQVAENSEVDDTIQILHKSNTLMINRLEKRISSLEKIIDDLVGNNVIIKLPKNSPCASWIDKQVEAGVYRDRNHTIETLILEKMKEKK